MNSLLYLPRACVTGGRERERGGERRRDTQGGGGGKSGEEREREREARRDRRRGGGGERDMYLCGERGREVHHKACVTAAGALHITLQNGQGTLRCLIHPKSPPPTLNPPQTPTHLHHHHHHHHHFSPFFRPCNRRPRVPRLSQRMSVLPCWGLPKGLVVPNSEARKRVSVMLPLLPLKSV